MAETHHTKRGTDSNPDPITGEPGSHPVGTGVGAAGGGATGAAIGTALGGPIGGAVGAVIGAIAGGLAGKGVAEAIDPTAEEAYWREQHTKQPFTRKDRDYDTYSSAYRTGYEGFGRYEPGTRFEDAEPTLREDYEATLRERHNTTGTGTTATGGTGTSVTSSGETLPTRSHLEWEEAKPAAKAAWERVERGEAVRVPLTEEQVNVKKREVESGAVRLRKVVKTETVNQPVELKREEIVVEKVSKDDPNAIPADAFREGDVRVPLKREEAVVEKTAHVTGEVQVRKTAETDTKHVHETIRKEDVKIENEGQGKVRREP